MRREYLLIFFILLGLTQLTFSNSEDNKFRYNWSNKQRIFKSEIKLQDKSSLENIINWLKKNGEKFQISKTTFEKNQIQFSSERIYKELGGYKLNFTMLMILNEESLRLKLSFDNAKTFRGFTYVPPKKRVDEILKEMKELKTSLVASINNGEIKSFQSENLNDTIDYSDFDKEESTDSTSDVKDLETLEENNSTSINSIETEINAENAKTDTTSNSHETEDIPDTENTADSAEEPSKTTETPAEKGEDGFSW